ncbi:MAG: trehalose-phosphatase [Gammaproteobacteria bacterium RIFCSPLOWO2_02_FULL_56_15]|nr:MAG: trehalose-phosphatase [Gammaproteobacteria bacterium RIFCSPLOWO2_02_FULL_56_15]
MRIAQPQFDLEVFFNRVRAAPVRVLMLDYDGTLAPFHIDPARATPYPGVVPLLDAIMDNGATRLVIVSGRLTKDLIPLLDLKRLPELWGSHSWERLQENGEYVTPSLRPRALELLVTADEWITEVESLGARTERKPACLAIHWRGLANLRINNIKTKVCDKWEEFAHDDELTWHEFDGGVELRAAGHDKGDVVHALAVEAGPDAALAYLGDDQTDEPAFKTIPEHGATVLVRPHYRRTNARFWIRPPGGLRGFLARWNQHTGGPS